MRQLKDAKDIYDHIVVPEELDARLRATLENMPAPKKKATIIPLVRWSATIAAALFLCFTVGLNTSEAFAMEAAELPLIGQIAKVLTIRSYETTEDTTTTTVTIPEVQVETADETLSNAITDVNKKIQSLVDEFTAEKKTEIEDAKNVFFASGGTEEEWESRSIDVNVNYEVKHQSDSILSLMLDGWISWFNFEEERHFYNIDLVTGKELTLLDFFGEDAYAYASDCVLAQMKERIAEDPENVTYWGVNDDVSEESAFIGVNEATLFYVNRNGDIVISYDKYDVAPGAMGIQEFVIPVE